MNNNTEIPDKMDYNGEMYYLMPGDEVVLEFACSGRVNDKAVEKAKLYKENPTKYPGNPTGIDFGITNLNCYSIKFNTGFIPNIKNKVVIHPIPSSYTNPIPSSYTNSTQVSHTNTPNPFNNPAIGAVDDDLPF